MDLYFTLLLRVVQSNIRPTAVLSPLTLNEALGIKTEGPADEDVREPALEFTSHWLS